MNYFFRKILRPYIVSSGYRSVCEIGASDGATTDKLVSQPGLRLTVIDPCIDLDLERRYAELGGVTVMKTESLKAIPSLRGPFDAILIDGDHNWYTVYNELEQIHERGLIGSGGTIFLHDMTWPYARRDMYYVPETIPQEFRHPYARQGVPRTGDGLIEVGGTNPHLYNACTAGGPRNGVLTAVEDFLKKYGKDYIFFIYRAEYGLGFLIRKGGIRPAVTAAVWRAKTRLFEWRLVLKTWWRAVRKNLAGRSASV